MREYISNTCRTTAHFQLSTKVHETLSILWFLHHGTFRCLSDNIADNIADNSWCGVNTWLRRREDVKTWHKKVLTWIQLKNNSESSFSAAMRECINIISPGRQQHICLPPEHSVDHIRTSRSICRTSTMAKAFALVALCWAILMTSYVHGKCY